VTMTRVCLTGLFFAGGVPAASEFYGPRSATGGRRRAEPGAPRARQLQSRLGGASAWPNSLKRRLDHRSLPSAMVASGLKWTELFQPELFQRAKILGRVIVRSVLRRQDV
jgi:hypothetical protein